MGITTEIYAKENTRVHKVIGSLNKSLLKENLNKIYSDPDFQPEMNVFWDFTRADLSTFTPETIEEIASFVKKHWVPIDQCKAALLAPEVLSNLITRKYSKEFNGHAAVNVKVFKSQEEALSWLK